MSEFESNNRGAEIENDVNVGNKNFRWKQISFLAILSLVSVVTRLLFLDSKEAKNFKILDAFRKILDSRITNIRVFLCFYKYL